MVIAAFFISPLKSDADDRKSFALWQTYEH